MERDAKPFKYVVLLGLDAFDPADQRALLTGFKDRLLADIRCETDTPWRRQHIADLRRAFRGHLEQDIRLILRDPGFRSGRK